MTLPGWLLLVSALLAGAVVVGVVAARVRLPLTVVLTLLGFAASGLANRSALGPGLRGEAFEEVVVFLFLPVLVFAAVLGTSVRTFFRNLVPIVVLATIAVVVSAAVVGVAVHQGLGIALPAALLFGVLISATDPVAVVAVFRDLGVPRRLLTLVEGESLLNDGVAIVGFSILLGAALGGEVSVAGGLAEFVRVFLGGTVIGALVGLAAALALPWLDRLAAAALSLAVAYGSFVLADDVLGVSGVMATVAGGLVLAGLAPSRAGAATRETWERLWESLDYVANALLFLFIGLALDVALLRENLGAIGVAVAAVLVARPIAVLPLVAALERFAGITRVGLRNEAVLVWGGLRGGVALALALVVPEELAERDTIVAMTGGVVLATLLLNATTIRALVHRLGLDTPTRAEQFLAAVARLSAVRAARSRLEDLGLDDPVAARHCEEEMEAARREVERIELTAEEEQLVVTMRGLAVERETYQHLSDAGLLPPAAARTLLQEVDDQLDEGSMGRPSVDRARDRPRPRLSELVRGFVSRLPRPPGEDPEELAYAEASARRLAAQRTGEALDLFRELPNVSAESVREAQEAFRRWEREAIDRLSELDAEAGDEGRALHQRQADALCRLTSSEALERLAAAGVIPESIASGTAAALARSFRPR